MSRKYREWKSEKIGENWRKSVKIGEMKYKCLDCKSKFIEPKITTRIALPNMLVLQGLTCPFCESTRYKEIRDVANILRRKKGEESD